MVTRFGARTTRLMIALVVAAVAARGTACADPSSLDTAPAPRPLPLFHLGLLRHGTSQFFYGLTVMNCDDKKSYWTFGERGAKASPDTVTYGATPTGFETVIGPLPLTPGCYRVLVTGGASTRFDVAADGRIIPRDSTLVTISLPAAPTTKPSPTH